MSHSGGVVRLVAHNRERSSAFLAANSSDERMPFLCNSASRSILANRSISWALSGRYGSLAGATDGSGALVGTPFNETTGRVEILTVPCWLVRVSEPPRP